MFAVVLRHRRGLSLLGALGAPVALAATLVPLGHSFASPAAALAMVVLIAVFAVVGRRGAALVASVSCAVSFDFFLTRPYYDLEIARRVDVESAIGILVAGFVISELAARSGASARIAHEESEYVEMMRSLAELSARDTPLAEFVNVVTRNLEELLALRACRFERAGADPPRPRFRADGDVAHVGIAWPVDEAGIPGPEAEIVARWRGETWGYFVLTPTPGRPVSRERCALAVALSTLAAGVIRGASTPSEAI